MKKIKRKKILLEMGKHTGYPCLFALLLALFIVPATSQADEFLEQLVQKAWESHPLIAAANSKTASLVFKVNQSKAWKTPVFSFEVSNLPVDEMKLGEHPMSGLQLKLSQTVPFPGKNSKNENASKAFARASENERKEIKNQIRKQLKIAYWNLAQSRQLKKVTLLHIQQIEQLIGSMESGYEIGRTQQYELLRLEALHEKLKEQAADYERESTQYLSLINGLLNRKGSTSLSTPHFGNAVRPSSNPEHDFERAKQVRPLIAYWSKEREGQQLSAKAFGYSVVPDPTLWAGYRFREETTNEQGVVTDEGIDFASIGIALPLPLFYKNSQGAKRQESLAKGRYALEKKSAVELEIREQLEMIYASWNRAYEGANAYTTKILPKQRQALNATLSAYKVGRSDFTSLYAAQVDVIESQRALIKAQAKTRIDQAKIQALVGDDLGGTGE